MQWQSTCHWAGQEACATPLYDYWSVEDGKLIAQAARGRLLQNTLWITPRGISNSSLRCSSVIWER